MCRSAGCTRCGFKLDGQFEIHGKPVCGLCAARYERTGEANPLCEEQAPQPEDAE